MIERRPDEPRRLHPSSLVFNLSKWIVRFIVPGIIVLFLGRGKSWEICCSKLCFMPSWPGKKTVFPFTTWSMICVRS